MVWILTLASLWGVSISLKGCIPCSEWSYINGGDCTITFCNSYWCKLKMAAVHCSETTHYIFRFWKWNSIQKILSFCVKIADRESLSSTWAMKGIYIDLRVYAYPHTSFSVHCMCVYVLALKSSCLTIQTLCVQNAAVYAGAYWRQISTATISVKYVYAVSIQKDTVT